MLVKQLFRLSVILFSHYYLYARTESICPNGWKTFNEKCYILHGDLLGANLYDSHSVICPVIYKARLLTIHSEEEQMFITTHLFQDMHIQFGVWIGAFRSEHGFIWLDGSHFEFANWQTGQPRNYNGTEYCAAMSMEEHEMGKWHDVFCTDRYLVMCEINVEQNSTAPVIQLNVAKAGIDLDSKLDNRLTNMIWDFHVAILVFMALIILTAVITYLLGSACGGYKKSNKSLYRSYDHRKRLALITVLFVYF